MGGTHITEYWLREALGSLNLCEIPAETKPHAHLFSHLIAVCFSIACTLYMANENVVAYC